MTLSLRFMLLPGLLMITSALASTNHIPQPWRADAVTEGRDADYGIDRFLQQFSFAHIEERPDVTENGLRGTGGSVTSNNLYYDFRLRQALNFEDSLQAFLLDIQRSEDFDGPFERQLVGLKYGLTESTEFWLQGDVFSDKSLIDVYFSGRQQFTSQNHQHWLHASVILTDAYFNDKTSGEDRIEDEPVTFFLQWRSASQQSFKQTSLLSVSYTPKTSIDSRSNRLFAESQSLRGAFSWRWETVNWRIGLDIEGEYSDRSFLLDESEQTGSGGRNTDFRRKSFAVTARFGRRDIDWYPEAGVRYFGLEEDGFFGRRSDQFGRTKRREPTLFFSGTYSLSPRQRLKPTIYLGMARVDQSFSDPEWRSRDDNEFIGKLSLPWQYVMSADAGAMLSVVLSANLHEAAFGGGNVQVNWPL